MRKTLYTECLSRLALPVAARTANAAVNGSTIDLGVFGNDFRTALFVFAAGTITDGTHTAKLQHSSDGSAWSDVPTDRLQGSAPVIGSSDDDKVFEVGYIVGNEQYVRCVVTTATSTAGGVFGAVALLGGASSSPVARS